MKRTRYDIAAELERVFPKALVNVRCGISLGLGWAPYVCEALAVIEAAGYEVDQIKPKFGRLCIYLKENGSSWPRIACEMAIRTAQDACSSICYSCGKLRDTPRLDSRCDECKKEQWA